MHTETTKPDTTPPAIDEATAHAVLDAEADADARWAASTDAYAWKLEAEERALWPSTSSAGDAGAYSFGRRLRAVRCRAVATSTVRLA